MDSLHLIASSKFVVKKEIYNDITIETYFFKEDAALTDRYIAYAKKYLAMYENLLTPYPYRRLSIVESIFPTGNSMPTITIFEQRVLKLPFIIKTSLRHEILHQWFGNSVDIDPFHGNWSEGLTSYLSDHYYTSLEERDASYRKQLILDYNAYVNKKMPFH